MLTILERNCIAPQKLAALFDEWMWLLDESAEAHVRTFCERTPEPSLPDFQVSLLHDRHNELLEECITAYIGQICMKCSVL